MARKPSDIAQLKLRFPEELRRKLERTGKKSDQSMNTEIVQRLERSFRTDPVAEMIDFAMFIETTAAGKSWKDDRHQARVMRIAVDQIIAAVAGLPQQPMPAIDETAYADWQSAHHLSQQILRRYGYAEATRKETPK